MNFQMYCKSKYKQIFCPLIWLSEQCYSWSSWWNSRRWVCRWRQQLSLRWFRTHGDVWTEMSNANIGTAENKRKLTWIRAFSRHEVSGTRLESVVLWVLPLLPAPSASCSGCWWRASPYTRQGTGVDRIVQRYLPGQWQNLEYIPLSKNSL